MLEYGNYINDDIPETKVQNDLCKDNFDKGGSSLSGRFWSDPIADVLSDLKQYETRQKLVEFLETAKHSQPGILGAAQFEKDIERIMKRPSLAEKVADYIQKREELIDCGFGCALDRMLQRAQGKAETEESMRRLSQIDWRPYTWNTFEWKR